MEREDLISIPDENTSCGRTISLAGRRAMYDFILHGEGSLRDALTLWLGSLSLEDLRCKLMLEKIASAGMELTDFSKLNRPLVPVSDRWRGDARTQTALMREIAAFRAEKARKRDEELLLGPAVVLERARREQALRDQLVAAGMTLEELPWSGLEPNRMTFNRLVEFGEEEPDPAYDGKGPRTTAERWLCGIRRLKLVNEVKKAGEDWREMMLDEVLYNRMMLYIEMGLHDDPAALVKELVTMRNEKKTQWTRPKKRTERWAFNFGLSDDEKVDVPRAVKGRTAE